MSNVNYKSDQIFIYWDDDLTNLNNSTNDNSETTSDRN